MQMIWLAVITILMWVLLNPHGLGAHIYLIGDNVNGAELMGINTGRIRIMGFMLVGIVSAFSGVLASLHMTYLAQPWRRIYAPHVSIRLPGWRLCIRRRRYHSGYLHRGVHHRFHRSCHGCHRPDRVLDPIDLRVDYCPLHHYAHLLEQMFGVIPLSHNKC